MVKRQDVHVEETWNLRDLFKTEVDFKNALKLNLKVLLQQLH